MTSFAAATVMILCTAMMELIRFTAVQEQMMASNSTSIKATQHLKRNETHQELATPTQEQQQQ
jgi:hypothetical protein